MARNLEHDYFGRYLQSHRQERKMSLAQLAEETRIGVATLEAIELEDFSRLPPEVFLKGFLRAYAQAVGADPEEALRRHDRMCAARVAAERSGREPERARLGSGRRMFTVLALLAALILGTLLVFRHWGEPPPQTAAPGAAENPSTSEADSLRVPSASDRTPQSAAEAKYVLTISAREGSWVKVVADLGAPAEYELKAGDRLRLEAQTKFNLLIGNAGGVALVLNDKPVPVPGKRGEIVNLHLP